MKEKDKQMFLGLYYMLLSDSEVHPKELELIYQIGKEKGGISDDEIQQALFSPNKFVSIENLSNEERIEYLYNLSRIAWADGKIEMKEKEMLQEASKRLGFGEENVEVITDFLIEQVKEKKSFEEILKTINNS